jgi:hypothetical protein
VRSGPPRPAPAHEAEPTKADRHHSPGRNFWDGAADERELRRRPHVLGGISFLREKDSVRVCMKEREASWVEGQKPYDRTIGIQTAPGARIINLGDVEAYVRGRVVKRNKICVSYSVPKT